MTRDKLDLAARRIVKQALKLRHGESFLLVTDREKLEIAEALAAWAKKVGAETTTYLMAKTLRPIIEPTRLLRQMAKKATAIAYLLEARIEEKPFRSFLVKTGLTSSRILMMPGITRAMMERLVNIDYAQLGRFTEKVIHALKDAEDVLVENARGTRLRFSVRGRRWVNGNGDISRKGKHGNLPAGECYTAPVEDTFTGTIVISLIDDKLGRGVMEFEKGRLVKWTGKGVEAVIRNIGGDKTGMTIGEFGIGTNKNARITANMLEAEKAFGTAHFAIGDSYGLGTNSSQHHYDALVEKVSIKAKGKVVIQNGEFLF
jgi:leucyl aminopeptidase (aminopeptidase T)